MAERVRLFRDDDEQADLTDGAQEIVTGPELGHLHVQIWRAADGDHHRWRGKILGSDYLVWGMNHRRVVIEFESGERRRAVVRATGDLLGLGPAPATIDPTTSQSEGDDG